MKNLLSIILAIVMIAAMLPSAFAATAFEGYEYVFTNKAFGVTDGSNYVRSKLATMTLETPDSSLSHPWKVAGSNLLYNVYAQTEGIVWNGYTDNAKNSESAFAIEISVSNGGTYKPSLRYSTIKSAPKVDIYLVKEKTEAGDYSTDDIKFIDSDNAKSDTSSFIEALGDTGKLGQVDMWGTGSYTSIGTESFNDLELQLDGNSKYYLCFRTAGVNDSHVASSGTYFYANIKSFKLTYVPSEADEAFDYTAEEYETTPNATVTALAAYGNENTIEDTDVISVDTATYGQKCNVSVKNKTVVKEGKTYNFLYWAKGMSSRENELALSTSESFDYMPQDGNNVLIAVYEAANDVEETATFYNANGQLLTDTKLDDDNTLPAPPSMAGYTKAATKWVQLGTNEEFDAGATVPETGDKIFIAKYDAADKKSDISVTVNGASADSTPTGTYAYGKEIICKADTSDDKVFMYWRKTVGGTENDPEIVSTDEEYSFYAWENCTVTAVYGDAKPSLAKDMRKIIISSVAAGNESAIMAEFIGFGDALEKGVMIGNRKIAMTTTDNQFTVVTDDEVTGYAIVGNATDGYEQITDK
ncbi:MAG: hypothetical protein IJF32_03730 [Oscillospiraceae bacterium]|nr:hypothetical protein [Oscillospiraceae bacterium]